MHICNIRIGAKRREQLEILTTVLTELRVLGSKDFDPISCFAWCSSATRLAERLKTPELLPLGSRIRRRLMLDYAMRDELLACLDHLLDTAANSSLTTTELKTTGADRCAGNYRIRMSQCDEVLTTALTATCLGSTRNPTERSFSNHRRRSQTARNSDSQACALQVAENLMQLSADVPLLMILAAGLTTVATVLWDELARACSKSIASQNRLLDLPSNNCDISCAGRSKDRGPSFGPGLVSDSLSLLGDCHYPITGISRSRSGSLLPDRLRGHSHSRNSGQWR